MKTITEVLAFNMRALRGDRTQAAMAELAGIPLRTYQNLEQGFTLPQDQSIEALAKAYGVPQTQLFLDPELTKPTPAQAIERVMELLEKAVSLERAIPPDIQEILSHADDYLWDVIRMAAESKAKVKEESTIHPDTAHNRKDLKRKSR